MARSELLDGLLNEQEDISLVKPEREIVSTNPINISQKNEN